ncbi:hypothetical protein HSHS1_16280 [Helicobacter suis HS1]|nr:hypothetical protein HSHS1_16280 [Helicobacter suis HS1]
MSPFEEPISNRLITPLTSAFGGLGADKVADSVGIVALSAAGIGIAMHALLSNFSKDKNEQA